MKDGDSKSVAITKRLVMTMALSKAPDLPVLRRYQQSQLSILPLSGKVSTVMSLFGVLFVPSRNGLWPGRRHPFQAHRSSKDASTKHGDADSLDVSSSCCI